MACVSLPHVDPRVMTARTTKKQGRNEVAARILSWPWLAIGTGTSFRADGGVAQPGRVATMAGRLSSSLHGPRKLASGCESCRSDLDPLRGRCCCWQLTCHHRASHPSGAAYAFRVHARGAVLADGAARASCAKVMWGELLMPSRITRPPAPCHVFWAREERHGCTRGDGRIG